MKQQRNLKQNHHLPRSPRYKTFFIATKESVTTYSDLTGRYPIISSRGNQYILICYKYYTNSIQETPTNTRNAADIQDATMSRLNTLTTSGHQPNIRIIDTEASYIIRQGLIKNKIKYHMLPPHL